MSKQKDHTTQSGATQETRDRIITAAYKVLAEKGYDATTLREISKEADAAPGLVHYYFGGKDQLLVEVLKEVGKRYEQMAKQTMQPTTESDLLHMVLQKPIDQIIEGPEWYRLRQELFALGLHNALIAPQVSELLAEGRASIASTIKHAFGETTIEPTVIATLLLAFFDGLALQKIMDPDLDISMIADVLAHILLSFAKK
ncbi:MAG TPA: TetR/AcrR family transcriptional regulator [Ktedonobacteraceae bacterium]|nr:TetR/AcrR family transcriptional regulator [Ktedonobacteraceae bacterium]